MSQNWGKGEQYRELITRYASARGLDPNLVFHVIDKAENAKWDPQAASGTGPRGLMQVGVGTAKDYGINDPSKLNDPETNIAVGTLQLKKALDKSGGDVSQAYQYYHDGLYKDPSKFSPAAKSAAQKVASAYVPDDSVGSGTSAPAGDGATVTTPQAGGSWRDTLRSNVAPIRTEAAPVPAPTPEAAPAAPPAPAAPASDWRTTLRNSVAPTFSAPSAADITAGSAEAPQFATEDAAAPSLANQWNEALNSTFFGAPKRVAAGINALTSGDPNKSLGENYNTFMDIANQRQNAYEAAHQGQAMANSIAGSVISAPAAGGLVSSGAKLAGGLVAPKLTASLTPLLEGSMTPATSGAVAALKTGFGNIAGRGLAGAGQGAVQGGLSEFSAPEDFSLGGAAERALFGAGIGGALGTAIPAVGKGFQAAKDLTVGAAKAAPESAALDALATTSQGLDVPVSNIPEVNNLSLGAKTGDPGLLSVEKDLKANSPSARDSAEAGVESARQGIIQHAEPFNPTTSVRDINSDVAETGAQLLGAKVTPGVGVDLAGEKAAQQAARGQATKAAYDTALAPDPAVDASIASNPKLLGMLKAKDNQKAITQAYSEAVDTAQARGLDAPSPADYGLREGADGTLSAVDAPSSKAINNAYQAINAQMKKLNPATDRAEMARLQGNKEALRDEFRKINPAWGKAVDTASDAFLNKDAMDAGSKFLSAQSDDAKAMLKKFQGNPDAMDNFRVGVARNLQEMAQGGKNGLQNALDENSGKWATLKQAFESPNDAEAFRQQALAKFKKNEITTKAHDIITKGTADGAAPSGSKALAAHLAVNAPHLNNPSMFTPEEVQRLTDIQHGMGLLENSKSPGVGSEVSKTSSDFASGNYLRALGLEKPIASIGGGVGAIAGGTAGKIIPGVELATGEIGAGLAGAGLGAKAAVSLARKAAAGRAVKAQSAMEDALFNGNHGAIFNRPTQVPQTALAGPNISGPAASVAARGTNPLLNNFDHRRRTKGN